MHNNPPRGLPKNAFMYVEQVMGITFGNEMKSVTNSEIVGQINWTNVLSAIQQTTIETLTLIEQGNYAFWMDGNDGSNDPGLEGDSPDADDINMTNALIGEWENFSDACTSDAEAATSMGTTQLKMTAHNQSSGQNLQSDVCKANEFNEQLLEARLG